MTDDAIVVDPSKPYRLIPADEAGRGGNRRVRRALKPRAYFLRRPTLADRADYKREMTVAGARNYSDLELLAKLAEGVDAILSDPDDAAERLRFSTMIAGHRERIEGFYAAVQAGAFEGKAGQDALVRAYVDAFVPPPDLKQVEVVVIAHYPPYREMMADRKVYGDIRGRVAARMFLEGWENLTDAQGQPIAYRRKPDGTVPESLLMAIPSAHLAEIGAWVEGSLEPTTAKVKG